MTAILKTSKAIKAVISPGRTLADKLHRADVLYRTGIEKVQNEYIERCREAVAEATADVELSETSAEPNASQALQQH
jgi:hypothetical protein